MARILLTKHVCANIDGKIALSRKIERNFRLIGWGVITKGYEKKNRVWLYVKHNRSVSLL